MTSVSCVMVTQPDHAATVPEALACFAAQTHDERELVVVHDADDRFDRWLRDLIDRHAPDERVSIERHGRASLGVLRNVSVAAASGELICQWDDDDLSHPTRIEQQVTHLERRVAAACFLTEQLHLFEATGELFYDDWSAEAFPFCFIQGTLLARREAMPDYPDRALGEDTMLLDELLRSGARLTGLQDAGELVVYRFTGANSWDEQHHRAISAWKHQRHELLADRLPNIRAALAVYPVAARTLTIEVDGPVAVTLGR